MGGNSYPSTMNRETESHEDYDDRDGGGTRRIL
jgi:hypothetical protein